VKIFASILNIPWLSLKKALLSLKEGGIDGIHLDIMDGHFVDNISFGPWIVEVVREVLPETLLNAHLMVTNIRKFARKFIEHGVKDITVHVEIVSLDDIKFINDIGGRAYIALNPETDIVKLNSFYRFVEGVLVMSVHPGFGGQRFIPSTFQRIASIRHENICVDGGVNLSNIKDVFQAGAKRVVVGSAMFKEEDIQATVRRFKNA